MLKRLLCCLPILLSLTAAPGRLPAETKAPLTAWFPGHSRFESQSTQEQSTSPVDIPRQLPIPPIRSYPSPCDCCAKKPLYAPFFSHAPPPYSWSAYFTGQIAIVTQQHNSDTGPLQNQVLVIWNLRNQGAAPTNTWWNPALPLGTETEYYSDPSWNYTNLGDVFGLTLDNLGNMYVAASNIYGGASVGNLGSTFLPPRRAGQIYKIANGTGTPSLFGDPLPNDSNGLGNIAWDCGHNSLYASDFHDGLIYRINAAGTPQPNPWDHGANLPSAVDIHGVPLSRPPIISINLLSSYTDLGRRPWAVRVYQGRLFYSIWSRDAGRQVGAGPNEIWSVALSAAGDPVAPARLEIALPSFPGTTYSPPVSDISFTAMGTMLVAERTMVSDSGSSAHESRALEFSPSGAGWVPSPALYQVGFINWPVNPTNSAGGVDFDFTPGIKFPVWVSGDALHYQGNNDFVYGVQGFPAAGGDITNSLLIDADDYMDPQNKTRIGDVRIPCPEKAVNY